jgi:hypothetical protein
MSAQVSSVLKWFWLSCSIGVLLLTFAIFDGTPATRDAEVVLLYGMLVLCFPVGQLVVVIFWLVGLLIETTMHKLVIPAGYLTLVVEWLIFFAAGYVQWFVLLPWLWRKWKARRERSAAPSV